VASGEGGLVSLNLIPDRVSPAKQKVLRILSAVLCLVYSLVLTYEGIGRMIADQTLTPILHIPKSFFWGFVVVGGISLTLHLILDLLNDLSGNSPETGDFPRTGSSSTEGGEDS
jgi:C4-dicarboxylate transporter DctQ subunit